MDNETEIGQDNTDRKNMETKKALIIIDIQNDYFEGGANPLVGSIEVSMNAKILLQFFREKSFNREKHTRILE